MREGQTHVTRSSPTKGIILMQKYYYDLHLHSCLSPCGDMDMTPNNIVNMAKLLGLDVIALTDHNTSLNCEAAMNVGVIPVVL